MATVGPSAVDTLGGEAPARARGRCSPPGAFRQGSHAVTPHGCRRILPEFFAGGSSGGHGRGRPPRGGVSVRPGGSCPGCACGARPAPTSALPELPSYPASSGDLQCRGVVSRASGPVRLQAGFVAVRVGPQDRRPGPDGPTGTATTSPPRCLPPSSALAHRDLGDELAAHTPEGDGAAEEHDQLEPDATTKLKTPAPGIHLDELHGEGERERWANARIRTSRNEVCL